jgi:hypothetical protein
MKKKKTKEPYHGFADHKVSTDKANQSFVYLTRVPGNVNANVLALFRKLDTPQEKDVCALQELIELTKLVHLYGGTGGTKG